MNIFAIDSDPTVAAIGLCDRHIVQMGREAVENLGAAHRVLDGRRAQREHWNTGVLHWHWVLPDDRENRLLSVRTGMAGNHHCRWARHSEGNYRWLATHALAIFDEYEHRYHKVHSYRETALWLASNLPDALPTGPRTVFCQGVAPDCYQPPRLAVFAHRLNYVRYKSIFSRWNRGRPPPHWFVSMSQSFAPRHAGRSKREIRASFGAAIAARPRGPHSG